MSDVRAVVAHQYGTTTARLDARVSLHTRFSVAPVPWSRWVYDRFALQEGELVLDVGAGTGIVWSQNLERLPDGLQLLLTDLSAAMCVSLAALPVSTLGVLRADATALPLPDSTVDVVIADHMLYHVPTPEPALGEIARVLKRGGRVYAATNGRAHMRELERLTGNIGVDYASTRLHHPFLLKTAAERISRFFSRVELMPFDDRLEVTEPDALVRYLHSVTPLTKEQQERLGEAVSAAIERDGSFCITKVVGLLCGRL